MALERRPPGDDRPRPGDIERNNSQPDAAQSRANDPWAKSDEERDRDFAEVAQLDREYLANNPRTLYGRHSSAEPRDGESRASDGGAAKSEPGDVTDRARQSDREVGPTDKVHDATPGADRWSDPDARRTWIDERMADPEHTKPVTSAEPWAKYQRAHAGDREVKLKTDNPDDTIWADGLSDDPETVVALEAKYVVSSDRSMYEGKAPANILDVLLSDFDREMRRYGNVVRHDDNPIGCIRLITNTDAAAAFLGERSRRVVGDDVRIDVDVRR